MKPFAWNVLEINKIELRCNQYSNEKIKKTTLRKNGIVARAEVYIHYIKAKKAMCCGASDTAKYIYRGFKLMIQKKYVTAVPALSALVIALKECELQDCL